jgi:hypothetical protein
MTYIKTYAKVALQRELEFIALTEETRHIELSMKAAEEWLREHEDLPVYGFVFKGWDYATGHEWPVYYCDENFDYMTELGV